MPNSTIPSDPKSLLQRLSQNACFRHVIRHAAPRTQTPAQTRTHTHAHTHTHTHTLEKGPMLQPRRLTVVWNQCRLRTKFQRQARGTRPRTADTMDMPPLDAAAGRPDRAVLHRRQPGTNIAQVRRLRTLRRAAKMALPRGLRASPTQNTSDEPGSCNNTEPLAPGAVPNSTPPAGSKRSQTRAVPN